MILLTKNLKQKRPNKKLSDKLIDPFIIRNRIETQIYRLTLPLIYQIHNVFHISLLKLYKRKVDNDSISNYTILELVNNIEK